MESKLPFFKKYVVGLHEENSGWVWSAKLRAELDVWLKWISELQNLDSAIKDEVWLPNSEGRFLITKMDYVVQLFP